MDGLGGILLPFPMQDQIEGIGICLALAHGEAEWRGCKRGRNKNQNKSIGGRARLVEAWGGDAMAEMGTRVRRSATYTDGAQLGADAEFVST